MDDENYRRLGKCFAELLEISPEDREVRLQVLQREDQSLAVELRRLLAADEWAERSGFLSNGSGVPESTLGRGVAADGVAVDGDLVGKQVRHYRLEERIGHGGMGTVYRAYDSKTDRHVAVKLIRVDALHDAMQMKRFCGEAKSAARMQHANIVPIYEVGEFEGRPYFTMSLVDGCTLKEWIERGPLRSREIASLFLKLAQALDYAHTHGVIHRDIKPANILLTFDGEPMLTDFGIAKRLDEDDGQTSTGQVLGTAVYMAPEQFEDAKNATISADIYGLGATLYECLSGQPPFTSRSLVTLFVDVRSRDPRPPHEIRFDVDFELEKICLRCLQKNPQDRYLSASELAEDLRRYLSGEPLASEKPRLLHSLSRLVQFRERHGSLASTGAAGWLFLLAVTVHPAVFAVIAMQQRPVVLWLVLGCWAIAGGIGNYYFHWRQYWQLLPLERQSGMLTLAVYVAFVCLFLIHGPTSAGDSVRQFLDVYPPLCLVTAIAICAHSGFHAGRWILFGSLFFPLALLINWFPFWGPLSYAVVSAITAAVIHRDLKGSEAVT